MLAPAQSGSHVRLLDRYIGRTVITTTLIVLAVLLALFTFMTFLSELKMVGRGHYGYLQALTYVVMAIPRLCYQFTADCSLAGRADRPRHAGQSK